MIQCTGPTLKKRSADASWAMEKKYSKEDLLICEWVAKSQISDMGLSLSKETFTQKEFDTAIAKLNSSPLLKSAFMNWCLTGQGCEQFPLNPIDPKNWEKDYVLNPDAFE